MHEARDGVHAIEQDAGEYAPVAPDARTCLDDSGLLLLMLRAEIAKATPKAMALINELRT